VSLLADWGMTERDIKARIAAAEAAARAQAKARLEAEARAKAEALARSRGRDGANTIATGTSRPAVPAPAPAEADGAPGVTALRGFVTDTIRRAAPTPLGSGNSTLTLDEPSRLGGPKAKEPAAVTAAVPAAPAAAGAKEQARQQFLRELHVSACRRFGTVLGPEANEAHRNHFHLDMAERPRGNFCE
jgi:hypothetical protein